VEKGISGKGVQVYLNHYWRDELMGKKGGDKRLKRMKAPAFWPIPRKKHLWTAKPSPGPHKLDRCLTLLLVIRDILGLASTYKEAKIILAERKVKVDGKSRRDLRFPIGVMDVVEIPSTGEFYRILPTRKGLALHPVDKEEAAFKLCRIEDKRSVKNGMIQLNLHDGRNLVIGKEKLEGLSYSPSDLKTYDALKITIPKQQVLSHLSFSVESYAIITGGKNIGRYGKVTEIDRGQGLRPKITTLQDDEGNNFQTIREYVFPLGEEKALISLPEVA